MLLSIASLAGPAMAQAQQMQLRYAPSAGRLLRTITWTDVAATIRDLPQAGQPPSGDTLHIDVSLLQSISERALAREGNAWQVERTLDSARGRMRAMAGSWRDLAADTSRPNARMLVSDRFQVSRFSMVGDTASSSVREWLRNPAGGFELTFPEGPVSVGSSWNSDLVFALANGVDLSQAGAQAAEGAELVAHVSMTLDSVVPRTGDTLAYLRVQGAFVPTTLSQAPEVGRGTASISGGFAGTMIWSTGWDAWVSGATRAQSVVRFDAVALEEGVQAGFELRMDVTSRFQVRP